MRKSNRETWKYDILECISQNLSLSKNMFDKANCMKDYVMFWFWKNRRACWQAGWADNGPTHGCTIVAWKSMNQQCECEPVLVRQVKQHWVQHADTWNRSGWARLPLCVKEVMENTSNRRPVPSVTSRGQGQPIPSTNPAVLARVCSTFMGFSLNTTTELWTIFLLFLHFVWLIFLFLSSWVFF